MIKTITNSIHLLSLLTILFVLFNNSLLYSQMPAHPDLLKKIKDGSIPVPYAMSHIDAIRKQGVDAPWSSPELLKGKSTDGYSRSYGPAQTPTGNYRALVLLVKFSDKPAQVTAASFDNIIYTQSAGTLWDYYKHVSFGTLDIVTVNLPSSTNWYTAPQTYAYYVAGNNGFGTYPQNAQKLAEDVVTLANPVVNYANYDNDNDGYVDALFIVHSGPGAEYTGSKNDIWSHAWGLHSVFTMDGVHISRYSMEPEYWQTPGDMTIGVYAHEMGHAAFGLPDLYDVDYTSEGLGNWSLMAGGSWGGTLGNSPSFPDAWCHVQMGFITPTVLANVNSLQMLNVEENSSAYILYPNGIVGNEYFIVENRRKIGYDTPLPNSGLCVYHVDENVTTDNTNEWYPGHTSSGHYMVALEQADGLWELEKNTSAGNGGDVFPGSGSKTAFNNGTTPNSKNYSSTATNIAINNIAVNGSIISANVEVANKVTVLSPNGSENWLVGSSHNITWTKSSQIEWSLLYYSTDGGSSFTNFAAVTNGTTSYPWTIPNIPGSSCKIEVIGRDAAGTFSVFDLSDQNFTISNPVSVLTLKAFIQGFYNGSTMVPDTVIVELHGATPPYTVIESKKSVLNSSGIGTFNFNNALNGTPYYLVIKHRNAIETWSGTGQSFTSSALSYDFTTASSKAYGNNLILIGTKYCIYNGDVNHDDLIDSGDLGITDNDNANYVTGYAYTDVNGDGLVDSSDLGLVDNNNANYIGRIVPAIVPENQTLILGQNK